MASASSLELQRHQPVTYSDPYSGSDSDSGSNHENDQASADLSNSIFKSYLEHSSNPDLSKIQSFLNSSSSGALSCLICLERIKPSHPTWHCTSLCYAVFHLHCIQSWARQASNLSAARALSRLPITAANAAQSSTWHCPKCRSSYSFSQIPKNYFCYCGQLQDPPSDNPWIIPHSCGEVCKRPLRNSCGHFCLLLCHPGPCPPCPQLVNSACFCTKLTTVKRCANKFFSCNNTCATYLDCKSHKCKQICHDGVCPPCDERGVYRCLCGRKVEEKVCSERQFRCDNPCNKLLGCGKHVCEKGCHLGECGTCPLQGKRTCPCGKRVYEGVPCDIAVSVCGSTCEKMLSCGYHRCHDRCHKGNCIETCRIVVTKSCRCGGSKKEVPCYQDLACERRCQKLRDCGRHACRRRCCDGDCPPCGEVCSKRLRCKNHNCPAPCHQGPCAPCPVMFTISCACGETHFEVPCGTEKDQKPPKCRKLCGIRPLCRHAPDLKPHRCHYGPCPSCRLLCEEEYPCGHKCKLRCHGPRPPPKLEFELKPKKKKPIRQGESTPGSPCPPCPELVWRSCVGQHVGVEKMMVCTDKTQFSCENLCGNPLPCGHHYCTKTCHPLKTLKKSESCEECHLPCDKKRSPTCQHLCPLPCHLGDCPPCKVLVKRSCHCGSMVHVFECLYYKGLSEKEQIAARSCGGRCHRKLPNCTHLCPEICHPGQCPSPDRCSKKVTVRCQCQTLKKEWLCHDVQAAYHKAGSDPKDISKNIFGLGLIPCDSGCKSSSPVVEQALNLRKSKVLQENMVEEKHTPKRKKRRERLTEAKQVSRMQQITIKMKRLVLAVTILVTVVAVMWFGYKAVLWLSDWMNELEEQRRHRKRPLRI